MERGRAASQNTAWPAPFLHQQGQQREGAHVFLFFVFPHAESLSRRSQGEHPRHKTAWGRSGWGVRESTPNSTSEQPLWNASLGARKASQSARSSSSTMATLLFFSPVHTGCFLRERPIFTLPHSHSLAQFQTNPKSLQSARHAAWIHTKPDTGGCVHNVPSLRDKVITHTRTRARHDTIRSSTTHFNTKVLRLLVH